MNLATHSHNSIPQAYSLISAGSGAEAVEDFELLDINNLVTGGREGFLCFEVTGDSSVDIRPGSLVFVDSWAEPRNGNIIAAECNGLVCLKVFERSHKGLYLVSSNPKYSPRQVKECDSFRVLGVVKGSLSLFR